MFDTLVLNFALDNPTVSIELDPRTLSSDWEAVIAGVGATHASLGVQTFAPHLQEAIGRVQPLAMIENSVRLLRNAGITSLNFDLMYGLPEQGGSDLAETLDRATGFGADRIALFAYAHVPHLIPHQRRIDASALPDQQQRFAMAEQGYRQLVHAGYHPVGLDHFALPGDPLAQAAQTGRLRRNFQGFTDDQAPVLIGLGASAISKFPDSLVQNEKNSGRYRMRLSQYALPAAHGFQRSADDQRRGVLIEQLLCRGSARIDVDLLTETAGWLAPFIQEGLCEVHGSLLEIGPSALPYARTIAAQFDPYRQHSPRRFSSAV